MTRLDPLDPADLHPTRYWHSVSGGRVQCDLCPRLCRLREGQRGFCFVRACHEGRIVLTTFGRASGFCVDPIEKKPLNHFLPGSSVLSFGTAGCNLGCKFCQNWDISKSQETDTLCDRAAPDTVARAALDLSCASVAFTYNDPVVFHEYAIAVADACRQRGIRTVAVTAGEIQPEPRVEFFRSMDAANIDLKAFSERFYRSLCSASLAPVLETIEYVARETDTWLELTTLLIPGENDGDEEIAEMCRWVVGRLGPDVPMHFTAFHPDWRMRHKPPTPPETVRRARQVARANGVRHAYTGNVVDPDGSRTLCSGCGREVVGREGYRLTAWHLDEAGRCRACGTACPGVYETRPGRGDGTRRPVRLSRWEGGRP